MTASQKSSSRAGCLIDTARPLTFRFEEQTISAYSGQSIAAALYAAGVRIFTRSFKYHRPRGLFCISGDCPNCLMQVDGRPNVRTCIEPVREGQVVCHQNAWPSLYRDVLHVFDKLDRFLPVGFYYKRFHKPRWLWPVFEHVVRHIAGLGKIDVHGAANDDAKVENLHTEICVIGGGLSGLAAARQASSYGARVLLLERQPSLCGRMLYETFNSSVSQDKLEVGLPEHPLITTLCNTTAFGIYEGNLVGAFAENRLLRIRARQIIVCTGSRQQPFLFHNNDLPGIMLGDGVLRLWQLYGVTGGRRAVVLTDNEHGYRLAEKLPLMGIELEAIVDHRPDAGNLDGSSYPILPGSTILRGLGRTHLRGVCIARANESGIDLASQQTIACDLLCLVGNRQPANELLLQGGVRYRCENGQWSVERSIPGLLAAGDAAGTAGGLEHVEEGHLRGAEAAAALGYKVPDLDARRRHWEEQGPREQHPEHAFAYPQSNNRDRKRFVCICEDVTDKDLHQAIAEGFDGIETLKRYSTVNMGPCQGKMCGLMAAEICARATGRDINAVGMTTSRPPAVPVEMGVLAAGQRHHPVRRTPMHYWHESAGARWLDAGQWKRPESYGDPVVEIKAVRTGVGLIDVSTLGKVEVIGPDATELLERVYLNRWADLKPGRVRYGAMCNEDGILIDDGVGARLGPERFYLTATTGNAEAIVQWLELWKATWRLNATILSQTSAFAAMNLAGPDARELLAQLTELDLSPSAFPYMALREGAVAGVPCRLFRIGFVGELGYEIHCPSSHAWHLWQALCDAGKQFDLKPFSVEAQRILRLEKGHLIIGQDTDALSNPLEAGLEWLVRFEKPSFIGREPLVRLKAMGPRSRLVGFMMMETDQVPPEGSQVVEQGRPVGRLTSTRFGPTLQRSLGLAWVPVDKARVGERFLIRWNGADVSAVVTPTPFYDPEGKQLKS